MFQLVLKPLVGGWRSFYDHFCHITEAATRFLERHAGADLIIVTGTTGVGKSSLIKSITGKDLYIGSTLKSGTQTTALVPAVINDRKYMFLDMPGFNADDQNDWHSFKILITAMAAVRRFVIFRGVLYVDPMNERRLTIPAQRLLTWLTLFCGNSFMPNVTIVTTMWDGLDQDGISDKLVRYELWRSEKLDPIFFSHGAKVYHHGLIEEGGKHKTLHVERASEQRTLHARQMIHNHYHDETSLLIQIDNEISNGFTMETCSAGFWLKTGKQINASVWLSQSPALLENKSGGFWSGFNFEEVRPWIKILVRAAIVYMTSGTNSPEQQWSPSDNEIFDDENETPSPIFKEKVRSPHSTSWSCITM